MMKRAIITIFLIPFLLSMVGCYVHDSTVTTRTNITPRFPPCPTGPLTLAIPLVMTSIGVNQYGKAAGVGSTPAHLLSAAIFHEPFKVAAERTKQKRRNMLAFGSGSPVVLDDISTAIEKLAFSADGSQVVATSNGIAGVWSLAWMSASENPNSTPKSKAVFAVKSRLIFRFPKYHIRHVGFVNYHGVQALLFMDDDGHGKIVTRDGMTTLAEFQHPGPARYIEVNATGSRILTVGSDFAVRIWRMSNLLNPAQLTLPVLLRQYSEPQGLQAVFSNDGERVLVTHCQAVLVYSVQDPNHPTFSYRLPGDELENIVEISRDGRFFVWVNRKGELHLRRIDSDKEQTISMKQGLRFKFVRPTISRDGKVFGQQIEGGWYAVWRERDKHEQVQELKDRLFTVWPDTTEWYGREPLLLAVDRRVDQLSLSAGGEGGVAKSEPAVLAWDLRIWDDQNKAFFERRVIPSLLLHSYIVQQDRETSPYTTAVIDPLGKKVAIGFESGRIVLYGARTSPKIESWSSVSLVADDWLPTESENNALETPRLFNPIIYGLKVLGGDDRFSSSEWMFLLESRRAAKVESLPEMTLQKVWEAIRKAIDQAQKVYERNGIVVLVVYMSGHGWIGPDGDPFFLPGDANASDSASWISYLSVVHEIEEFVGTNPKKRAVVIFDTCQTQRGEAGHPARQVRTSSPYVTLIQSASPGQYAWQYGASSSISGERTVEEESRWGLPRPPKAERGKFESEQKTFMSVLPLGSKCYLNEAAKQTHKEAQASGIASDQEVPGVNLLSWLSGIEEYAKKYLELTPAYTEYKERFRVSQDIIIDISEENKRLGIFLIDQEDIHD